MKNKTSNVNGKNLKEEFKLERRGLTITCGYGEGFKSLNKEGLKPTEILLGYTEDMREVVIDLDTNSNLIISGTTGSGKSTMVDYIVSDLVAENDPKNLELYFIQTVKEDGYKYNSLDFCKECITPHDYDNSLKLFEKAEKVLKDLRDQAYDISLCYSMMLDSDYTGPSVVDFPRMIIVIDEASSLFNYKYTDKDITKLQEECKEHMDAINRLGRTAKINSIVVYSKLYEDILGNPINELESVSDILM